MKKSISSVWLVVVLLCGMSAQAEVVNKVRIKGENAYAHIQTTDGCIQTYTYVSAWEQRHPGEDGSVQVYVSIYSRDTCMWTTVLSAYGVASIPGEDFKVKPHRASLTAVIPITRVFIGSIASSIEIDLTFTADGEYSSHGHSNYVSTTPTARFVSRYNGTWETADVEGYVFDGTTDFAEGAVSIYSHIGRSNNGWIELSQ